MSRFESLIVCVLLLCPASVIGQNVVFATSSLNTTRMRTSPANLPRPPGRDGMLVEGAHEASVPADGFRIDIGLHVTAEKATDAYKKIAGERQRFIDAIKEIEGAQIRVRSGGLGAKLQTGGGGNRGAVMVFGGNASEPDDDVSIVLSEGLRVTASGLDKDAVGEVAQKVLDVARKQRLHLAHDPDGQRSGTANIFRVLTQGQANEDIVFTSAKSTELEERVIAAALTDARSKAEKTADRVGVKCGAPIGTSILIENTIDRVGQVKKKVRVSVRYEIVQ